MAVFRLSVRNSEVAHHLRLEAVVSLMSLVGCVSSSDDLAKRFNTKF
jgi:hypothetical protein